MKRAKAMISIFGVWVAIYSGMIARAQEVVLPLSTTEAHYVSAGIDDTGPISVTVKIDGDRWLSFEIESYGKKYQLSDKQLAELKGLPLGSLQLTYGADAMLKGPDALHCIYLEVSKTTTKNKEVPKDEMVLTTSVTITISKSKGLEVGEVGTSMTLSMESRDPMPRN